MAGVLTAPWSLAHDPLTVSISCDLDQQRKLEDRLLAAGLPLTFSTRADVAEHLNELTPVFLNVTDRSGSPVAGFALRVRPAPFIPGAVVIRAEQLGRSLPLFAAEAALTALTNWLRKSPRILRLSLDLFHRDGEQREALGRVASLHGFRRSAHANGYEHTLILDLDPAEKDLLARLHHSARRKVRQIERLPVSVRPIRDPALEPRMNQLLEETLSRTGGLYEHRDWQARMRLSNARPDLSRIVGLFRNDVEGPSALLAFAWGCHNVDHAYYSEAASTRDTGDLRIPLAYALMWDLILWAKQTNAVWFDLGGITMGSHGTEDPLGGISDFKRYFAGQVATVREEWILDGHSWQSRVAARAHLWLRR